MSPIREICAAIWLLLRLWRGQGFKAPVEPDKFTVLDGKLYLNYNAQVQGT